MAWTKRQLMLIHKDFSDTSKCKRDSRKARVVG
jgi:hypothetical protein